MSLRLVRAIAEADNLDDLHLGRLLVLLGSADARKSTPNTKAKAVEGITKLAKLDFLLRYPTCLERALSALGRDATEARVEARERTSIEAKMMRFRYGPWDARYRRWLGLLAARDLVTLGLQGNTVQIGLTEAGRAIAEQFRVDPLFVDVSRRADVVLRTVGTMSATRLKDFIYEVIPEIIDMKWGEKIEVCSFVLVLTSITHLDGRSALKFRLSSLVLALKRGEETINFNDVSYFWGQMGAGKTSIVRLIDYCLGGEIELSPAMQSEFASATLNLSLAFADLSIERPRNSDRVIASWGEGNSAYRISLPRVALKASCYPERGWNSFLICCSFSPA